MPHVTAHLVQCAVGTICVLARVPPLGGVLAPVDLTRSLRRVLRRTWYRGAPLQRADQPLGPAPAATRIAANRTAAGAM